MNKNIVDEIQDDIWHILLHAYTYQDKSLRILEKSPTRYDLANDTVALNAIAESLVLRVARLADQSKGVRSIKNLLKKNPHVSFNIKGLFRDFKRYAEPVLQRRHSKIAHMKVGKLSSYPFAPLNTDVIKCIEVLVKLVDELKGKKIEYSYSVGRQELLIDLRRSVSEGKRIEV